MSPLSLPSVAFYGSLTERRYAAWKQPQPRPVRSNKKPDFFISSGLLPNPAVVFGKVKATVWLSPNGFQRSEPPQSLAASRHGTGSLQLDSCLPAVGLSRGSSLAQTAHSYSPGCAGNLRHHTLPAASLELL